jgi:hypothetical protein
MKRRHKIGLTVLAIAIAAAAVVILSPSEPVYEGKTLTGWLSDIEALSFPDNCRTNRTRVAAIEHMSADAVPFLLEQIRFQPHASQF